VEVTVKPRGTELEEKPQVEREFESALPEILAIAEQDRRKAVAAIDRYLQREPPSHLRKSLLVWKGRLYLEHGRHEEAARELWEADALPSRDDLQTLNIRMDLAEALAGGGDPRGAYDVLAASLSEIKAPPALLKLLHALAGATPASNQPMPPQSGAALRDVRRYYGIEDPPATDPAAEAIRLAKLVDEAAVGHDRMELALLRAGDPPELIALLAEYIRGATVPYFRELAEEVLRQIRGETAAYDEFVSSLTSAKNWDAMDAIFRSSMSQVAAPHLKRMLKRRLSQYLALIPECG
jgi:hypothetical protein